MSNVRRLLIALLVSAALWTALAGGAFGQSDNDGATGDGMTPQLPQVHLGGLFAGRSVDDIVNLAKSNAADRAGVTVDQVDVVGVRSVEWPDASLGCASATPHLTYAQVVTPGYIVQLDAAGTPMTYHTDTGLRAIPCEAPPAPSTDS
jgi:hypothetical protein